MELDANMEKSNLGDMMNRNWESGGIDIARNVELSYRHDKVSFGCSSLREVVLEVL